MAWNNDHLSAVETLVFRSELVKVGRFVCAADHPCFPLSRCLDNDVFVVPTKPVWIRRNAGVYRFAEPGAVLMHRAGSMLERRRATDVGERTYWFGVHPDVFVDTLQRHGLPTEAMGGALIPDLGLRYRLALFFRQLGDGAADRQAIEEQVLALFFDICARRAGQPRHSRRGGAGTIDRQRRLVDRTRAYLDARLTETVGLETVADAAGTSLFHLCRVFRERTGLTMHAYRTRQRVGAAVDRLVSGGSADLTELALELGFSSHSHLSRVFQKQMGVPPSAIRSAGV